MVKKLRIIISMVIMLTIFSFAMVCSNSGNTNGEKDAIVLEDKEKSVEDQSVQEVDKESEEGETGLSKEAEYILSVGNLLTRIGDHLILINEVTDNYNYGDIKLAEFKAYIDDFIMMFNQSYYPDYLDLEPPVDYENHYKYIGSAMEHIGNSTEYFQDFIDSDNEEEMLDNLDKALLEIEQAGEWVVKVNEEVNKS